MDDSQSSRYTQTKTNNLAIISLVAGLLGWIIPFIGAIVAVITGHRAKSEIRESDGTLTGNGIATVGLVLGYIQLIALVSIVCIMTITLLGSDIGGVFSNISESIATP